MPLDNLLLFRQLAALFFVLDLLSYLPYAQTCLGPGYWSGTFLGRRGVRYLLYILWAAACLSLFTGFYPSLAALYLFVIFRQIYIKGRWNTLFRGGGAPGFMSHYALLYILLFEIARRFDPAGRLLRAEWTMFRVDFGVVLLCSGTYKSLSGYLKGEGMEYGLANPIWGYFWRFFKKLRPNHPFLQSQDRIAALSQIVMGLLLAVSPLFPRLGWIGAVMCAGTFLYLLFTVRLGRLAPLMMIMALPYLPDLGVDLGRRIGATAELPVFQAPTMVVTVLCSLCWTYIVALPIVKAMQYTNLFLVRRFPEPLQTILTRYQNWVPIIMWRVFTPDVTNFFIRIRKLDSEGKGSTPIADEASGYSYCGTGSWPTRMRFLHVTESIAVTTIFTTLKYFQSRRDLFEGKLVAYARTLGSGIFEFEYVAIQKGHDGFAFVPVGRFRVQTSSGALSEDILVPGFDYRSAAAYSHIKETVGYGSYAPAERSPAP